MQLTTYHEILERIAKHSKLEKLSSALGQLIYEDRNTALGSSEKDEIFSALFETRESLSQLRTDPKSATMIDDLNLQVILSHKNNSTIVSTVSNAGQRAQLWQNPTFMRLVSDIESKLSAICYMEKSIRVNIIDERNKSSSAEETIELEVMEYAEQGFYGDRLALIFSNLQKFCDTVQEIVAPDAIRTRIGFLDSGSDLVVGVKLDGKLVKEFRETFRELWRRLRSPEADKIERKIETTNKVLDCLERIQELNAKGAIDQESKSRLEFQLNDSINKLYNNGVMLREDNKTETTDTKTIFIEDTKQRFLTSGKNE